MKIVLAFDSFKGTMSAREACAIAAEAIVSVHPAARLVLKPMADGGEGTADAVITARGGEWISIPATGPLTSMVVDAGFGWIPDDRTAVVEMAAASGITLLRPQELNPLRTTTIGTGELVRAAAERGAARIILAVGGSATVDGGTGAAQALGWRFTDRRGRELPPIGASLNAISFIQPPIPPFSHPPVLVLADVNNPLCGDRGAARIFGPQKGATPAMVEQLDAGLHNLADRIRESLGVDVLSLPGGGAAGGLAAGAVAFMGAEIVPGIDTIMEVSGLAEELCDADWIITGEGRFDEQSLHGKVVSGITRLARRTGAKVAVMAGSVLVSAAQCEAEGIRFVAPTASPDLPLEDALRLAVPLLAETATRFAREWL